MVTKEVFHNRKHNLTGVQLYELAIENLNTYLRAVSRQENNSYICFSRDTLKRLFDFPAVVHRGIVQNQKITGNKKVVCNGIYHKTNKIECIVWLPSNFSKNAFIIYDDEINLLDSNVLVREVNNVNEKLSLTFMVLVKTIRFDAGPIACFLFVCVSMLHFNALKRTFNIEMGLIQVF